MNKQSEQEPASVSGEVQSKQAGDTLSVYAWVERSVWTNRMLNALATGVKGGKWFSLMDKVYAKRNLLAAFKKVSKNKGSAGVDHVTVKRFGERLEQEIDKLRIGLGEGTYNPQKIKRVYIPKPGSPEKRPLGIPTVRDRVVQTALRSVIEPIFEQEFAAHSYGFRPGRGCKDALRRVDQLLRQGKRWIIDLDFKSYFDTIPHKRLMNQVAGKISDQRILDLIEQFLSQSVMDEMKTWTPEAGTPQGAVISPLLSNIYLDPLDHLMVKEGFEMVRYADDAVVICESKEDADAAMDLLKQWVQEAELTLHPTKTKIVDILEPGGFDFLGYHFEVSKHRYPKINRWPRRKSLKKLRESLKPALKRGNGHSLETIIKRINPILKGWFEYFKSSKANTFDDVDGWVRMRLRSILRKRRRGRGRGRGKDHQRWPNSYFRNLGLYSMAIAHKLARQSSSR